MSRYYIVSVVGFTLGLFIVACGPVPVPTIPTSTLAATDTQLPPSPSPTLTITPSPTSTFTPSPIPTDTPTTIPPTTAAPTSSPTPTPTSTLAPSNTPEPFYIVSHSDEQGLGCASASNCIIRVRVQWVPDYLQGNRNLYILVRPLPTEAGHSYWVQKVPEYVGNAQWESNEVYIGIPGDASGTHFRLCAVVTFETHSRAEELTQPPAGRQYCIDVYR